MSFLAEKIAGFFRYLLGKRGELARLNRNDILMAKVVLDIHRKRIGSEFVFVPLEAIAPIHPIDRGSALDATLSRARTVEEHKDEILAQRRITREFLGKHIPSISWIKIVEVEPGNYVSYEGNGRLAALQQVFAGTPGIEVEVEIYHFRRRDRVKMKRRIDRIRRWNGLLREIG